MKAVMLSVQPKWCELIASGEKTVEVRKTKPKLETPFKVYIYCTQGDALAMPCLNVPKYTIHRINNGTTKGRQMTVEEREQSDHSYANGKVIGEFVCDSIYPFHYDLSNGFYEPREFLWGSCLSLEQLKDYVGGSLGYAWHITDLVIYDKPKEVGKFERACPDYVRSCSVCRHSGYSGMKCLPLTKPPQSWYYVEEK